MTKSKFVPVLFLIIVSCFAVQAGNPPLARIGIVSFVDTAATHVFSNRFNAKITYRDFFNYKDYSVRDLQSLFAQDNIEVVEIEVQLDYESKVFVNLLGQPGNSVKIWLSGLKDKYDLDFIIVILRKFVPGEDISNRHLGKAQYGIATYQHHRRIVSIFSYVGYYIYSLSDLKAIRMNSNHDKPILLDFPVERSFTHDELQNLTVEYTGITAEHLQNIAYTRDREIYRIITRYLQKMNSE